ncbi:Crp/Fnr family transcriptional regulator [Membranihabitans marinus]|uniref:Crp/Fnr family transcriptional regulator n=1 Tax=Membranihabitans marinus TaxID=1227546 RepID=UPI001F2412C3|nr:Crp/Fnr family transcriptional regulator [Membranihabitans marinus]
MENEILDYLSEFITLNEEERNALLQCISIKTFPKGSILIREGDLATHSYFVIEGCIRQYYIEDGIEKTTHFYTENQSTPSYFVKEKKTTAQHFLACTEKTKAAVCNAPDEMAFFKDNPRLESLSRMLTEQDFVDSQEAFAKFVKSTPEERYKDLLKNRPDLINRVPQYQLASYLGIKPESLSRIRKRLAKSVNTEI